MPYILMFIVLFPFGYTARILWLHIFVNVNPVKGTWALTYTERVLRTETEFLICSTDKVIYGFVL